MTEDASRYDRSFFDHLQKGSLSSARIVLPIVLERFNPRSLVDIGCGIGTWAAVAIELGITDVIGVDGHHVSPDQLIIPGDRFLAVDLASDNPVLGRRFDLCISLEVAEHLPPERSHAFVKSLTDLSDVVLFSAAIPHQGGRHHINEQWQSYWVGLFNEHDYGAKDMIRPAVWADRNVEPWYQQNCLVYVKGEPNDRRVEQYDIVHPERYLKRIGKLTEKKARTSNAAPSE